MGKFSNELKWGAIFTVAVLLWSVIEKTGGLYSTQIENYAVYTNLFAIVAITIYVLALREKKHKFFSGNMNWKQGFVSGLYMTVVITILSPLSQLIIHKVIAPEFLPNLINYKVSNGYLTRTAAESYFNLESQIYQSSSFALSVGVVTSAIVAFFVKTKKS